MIGLTARFSIFAITLPHAAVGSPDWFVSALLLITAFGGDIDPAFLFKLSMFFWGAFGFLALDVLEYAESFDETETAKALRYKRPGYLCARLLMAIVAGGLAVGLDANTKAAALCIGAGAPLILRRLAAASINRTGFPSGINVPSAQSDSARIDSDHPTQPPTPTQTKKAA